MVSSSTGESASARPNRRSAKFRKAYNALPKHVKAKVVKAFKLFKQDHRHPSLHTKKIKGAENMFEGRIDIKYRFIFEYIGEDVWFLDIGPHDIIDDAED